MYTKDIKDTDEIRLLKEHKRVECSARMILRYDVVIHHLQEEKTEHIAKIFGITYKTALGYIQKYHKFGIVGLIPAKGSGCPKKLTEEQEAALYDCISTKTPKDVGFEPFVNWTSPLACQWVKQKFSVSFSERGMRDVFYRLGLSHTRPTYVLKKADAQQQEQFKSDFEELKKN